jgi:hypothetical protein
LGETGKTTFLRASVDSLLFPLCAAPTVPPRLPVSVRSGRRRSSRRRRRLRSRRRSLRRRRRKRLPRRRTRSYVFLLLPLDPSSTRTDPLRRDRTTRPTRTASSPSTTPLPVPVSGASASPTSLRPATARPFSFALASRVLVLRVRDSPLFSPSFLSSSHTRSLCRRQDGFRRPPSTGPHHAGSCSCRARGRLEEDGSLG